MNCDSILYTQFLPRDAMHSAAYVMARCLSTFWLSDTFVYTVYRNV